MFSLLHSLLSLQNRKRIAKHLSNNAGSRIAKLIVALIALVVLNSMGMVVFEKMQLGDALWLSFTTVVTVGYGDFSPSTAAGRVTTIITLYSFAITMLSLLAAEIIEWRLSIAEKKRRGLWEFKSMVNHIQIINTPNYDTDTYLSRLVKEMQSTAALEYAPIQLLSRKYPEGLPPVLSEKGVLLRSGTAEDGEIIHKINLAKAKYVVILAREYQNTTSDSVTFDILYQVLQINRSANIVVEAVLDENRARFLKMGANSVIRPIRAYPEIVVRALTNPGTERVLENLFQAHGDSIERVPCCFNNLAWSEILSKCIAEKIGTPLAFFSGEELEVQPDFDKICSGDALAILCKEKHVVDLQKVRSLFN